jgi:site-specific DNA-methyltransferase (adenine-specific)
MVVTSPPYWNLRDYGVEGQLGLEPTFEEYIRKLCDIFDEVKRVLKKTGTCWVNLGDTYASQGGSDRPGKTAKVGSTKSGCQRRGRTKYVQTKSLCLIPERFAIGMIERGWILRNEIIWAKSNCMPSSANDRFTVDFEKMFFFSKSQKYYFEKQYDPAVSDHGSGNGIKKPQQICKGGRGGDAPWNPTETRNKRCVWNIPTKPFPEAHFAVYPEGLIETPLKAGCPEQGVVLDPFMGSGTTAIVALQLNRNFIGIELNPEYIEMAYRRIKPYLE